MKGHFYFGVLKFFYPFSLADEKKIYLEKKTKFFFKIRVELPYIFIDFLQFEKKITYFVLNVFLFLKKYLLLKTFYNQKDRKA